MKKDPQSNENQTSQGQTYGKLHLSSLKSQYLKQIIFLHQHFKNQSWDLSDRKFKDLRAQNFFKLFIEVNCKNLLLDYNKIPPIIKSISHCYWFNLETIYLGDNNILSIESLSYLNMPKIKTISLNDNLITNIRPLRKCHFIQLTHLSLSGNKIYHSFQIFEQMSLSKIQKLRKFDYLQNKQRPIWDNLNCAWIMKTSLHPSNSSVVFDSNFIMDKQLFMIKLKIRKRDKKHLPQQAQILLEK